MENNLNQDNITPTSNEGGGGDEVKKDFQGLLGSVKKFLSELLDIRTNTDQQATKEAIIADIPFKGHTSWILICSIFIASIGLNANSTAVVIGAMLISPLMGPILGIGMSVAINDIDTLKRSLKNFAVMVVLSVITAYLFYRFFPLRDESSELLARTEPDIRDVLIAFFGGLALVIARAKKGTIASVIFGVAIATALMPPLCTVGFGLAIGNWGYASGAMYLFIINTIFIALATFLVIKLLRFPMVRYVNSQRRKLIARLASLLAILVMIPAGFTFYNVFKKSLFNRDAEAFITEKIEPYQFAGEGKFLKDFSEVVYNDEGNSKIELFFMGNDGIPDNVIATWRNQMSEYKQLSDVELAVVQGSRSEEANELKYVNELYESQKSILTSKDEKIQLLENELMRLNQISSNQIPFKEISLEAKTNYENLERLGYAYLISTDFTKTDSIPLFEVTWKKEAKRAETVKDMSKLQEWLRLRLNNKNIQIKEMPKD
ncbi:DUF389 domain-containing protein [Maribacter litoralis]|uniref:Uncharacterized hydrophobic domain-containing protein n=1 Tax=Maribacter litoralis TaxID=2059726 RepID=A0A653NML6_9FLAO|nr:DUF389 domain-containing protein [Maribacter litoralis]VXB18651.1 Uncharacterized hydrophobic domain-containing protein [Maribacter litoralis]